MPLQKVIRHGVTFWEPAPAPKAQQLPPLPAAAPDRHSQMSEEGRARKRAGAVKAGFASWNARRRAQKQNQPQPA